MRTTLASSQRKSCARIPRKSPKQAPARCHRATGAVSTRSARILHRPLLNRKLPIDPAARPPPVPYPRLAGETMRGISPFIFRDGEILNHDANFGAGRRRFVFAIAPPKAHFGAGAIPAPLGRRRSCATSHSLSVLQDLNPRLQTGRGFSRFFVHRLTP